MCPGMNQELLASVQKTIPNEISAFLVEKDLNDSVFLFDSGQKRFNLQERVVRAMRCTAAILEILGYKPIDFVDHYHGLNDFIEMKSEKISIRLKAMETNGVRAYSNGVYEILSKWIPNSIAIAFFEPLQQDGRMQYMPISQQSTDVEIVKGIFFCLSNLGVTVNVPKYLQDLKPDFYINQLT